MASACLCFAPWCKPATGRSCRYMALDEREEERYMRRAIRLAERGRGRVTPNPIVGAVVVSRGRIVGEGWHRAIGLPHAEVEALKPERAPKVPRST